MVAGHSRWALAFTLAVDAIKSGVTLRFAGCPKVARSAGAGAVLFAALQGVARNTGALFGATRPKCPFWAS